MQNLDQLLSRFWNHASFRLGQKESIDCILRKRDSLTVLPTGAGKSVCYQLPALLCDGLAVVVSPLIALMRDQIDALNRRGIAAATVNSSQTPAEKRDVAEQIVSGHLKLLYVAPERLLSPRTLKFLQSQRVAFFAIDEAHCVSQWGHDFRPEYTRLSSLRKHFPDASVHAFTATASAKVRDDITDALQMRAPSVLVGEFDRPNLIYRFTRTGDKLQQICDVLRRHQNESGIVYCNSRREVDTLTKTLKTLGWPTGSYHAGMSSTERTASQNAFLCNHTRVLVATVAFGMGVDKPDIRFVIHAGMPRSIEQYQQESGRAGRDGNPAECTLIHTTRDFLYWKEALGRQRATELDALHQMYNLCNSVQCRHASLAKYFGQKLNTAQCEACDVCLGELEKIDNPVETAQKILACVMRLNERFGASHVATVLAGLHHDRVKANRHQELSTFGALSDHSTLSIRTWIGQLCEQGYLSSDGEFPTLSLTDSGRRLMQGHGCPTLTSMARSQKQSDAESFVPAISSVSAFEHFRAGDSIRTVARKMNRAESTVAKYLADYLRYHKISDPTPWVDPAVAERVMEHRQLAASGALKPLYEHLGGEVDYTSIRITLACANNADRSAELV